MGGKALSTDAVGAKANPEFGAAAVSWVGPIWSRRGKARVYIDRELAATVEHLGRITRRGRVHVGTVCDRLEGLTVDDPKRPLGSTRRQQSGRRSSASNASGSFHRRQFIRFPAPDVPMHT